MHVGSQKDAWSAPSAGHRPDEQVLRRFLGQQDMLRDYILALVRNPDDAEDLFQEVAVQILGKSEGPREPERFPAWCRGVARNMVLLYWRRKRRFNAAVAATLIKAIDEAYEEADREKGAWDACRRALRQCIEKLPASSRKILEMRYATGMKSEEIARQLQRNAGAVRVSLLRLRQALGRCVEARLAEAET
jgi:RNA polymerase sigma-70 factor (ECF subfamily)